MPIEQQARPWQLVPCSQQLGEEIEWAKKEDRHLLAPNRLSRGRRRMLLEKKKNKNFIISQMPKMKNITP